VRRASWPKTCNTRGRVRRRALVGLVDYLEPMLVKQMVASLTELLRPGGVILAMFS